MNKIYIWDENKLKKKISLCIAEEQGVSFAKEKYLFPLEEILLSFYKTAVITEDFYSIASLEKLVEEYNDQKGVLEIDMNTLIREGWILITFGRWSSALGSAYSWKEIGEIEEAEFPNAAEIRFLLWLKKEEKNRGLNIEVLNPKNYLESWKKICEETPDIEWFLEHHYLVFENGKYYAWNGGYSWNPIVDRVLARLWLLWKEDRKEQWMGIVWAFKRIYQVLDYLEGAEQEEVIHLLLERYLYRYPQPSWEEENRFYQKIRMLEFPKYCREPEKYASTTLWTGNRVIDLFSYHQYGFEGYRWIESREYIHSLMPNIFLKNLHLCKDGKCQSYTEYLNAYDKVVAFYSVVHPGRDVIYHLLTTQGTLFMGFRYLIKDAMDVVIGKAEYVSYVIEIMEQIFEEGTKKSGFLSGEEIGNCLFYLMKCKKSKENSYSILLEEFLKLIGKAEYLELLAEEICDYFETLLLIKNDVDWVVGYHLILSSVEAWFYRDVTYQEKRYDKRFLDIVWKGYQMVFDGKSTYITYIKESYFSKALAYSLYKNYIKEQNMAKRRKLLLPNEVIQYTQGKNEIYYFYRLLLRVLYYIYEQTQDSVVKNTLFEVLERVLLCGDNKERPIFDYVHMQIFATETIVGKCIALLKYEEEATNYLIKNLLELEVPELLLFYESAQDEKLKNALIEKINENATEKSLIVFEDAHAIDLVLENEIESLYSAVAYRIEQKLSNKKEMEQKTAFYQKTIHQKWWLCYCKKQYKDILEGENAFFQAIVYMETEEYKDYEKAEFIWKKMISDKKRNDCSSIVFLNYLYLLNLELKEAIQEESDKKEKILQRTKWLINIIENEQIRKWSITEREKFGWLVVENKKMHGGDYLQDFYLYQEKYQLSMCIEDFTERKEEKNISFVGNLSERTQEEIVNALREFDVSAQKKKAQIHYKFYGYETSPQTSWETVLLVEIILQTCYALQNYGPQLIFEDKIVKIPEGKDDEKVRKEDIQINPVKKLSEDRVTMLFREMFNLAFSRFYGFSVHDQEKRGTTGVSFGGYGSPAEIDLSVYYKEICGEIIEAFVLENSSSKSIFKNHIGKIIGNNVTHRSLAFVLLYGNAKDSQKAWQKYEDYVAFQIKQDFYGTTIVDSQVLDILEAPYYLKEFQEKYTGLKLLRQKVFFKDDTFQEILHIYMDLAKNEEGEIRSKMK